MARITPRVTVVVALVAVLLSASASCSVEARGQSLIGSSLVRRIEEANGTAPTSAPHKKPPPKSKKKEKNGGSASGGGSSKSSGSGGSSSGGGGGSSGGGSGGSSSGGGGGASGGGGSSSGGGGTSSGGGESSGGGSSEGASGGAGTASPRSPGEAKSIMTLLSSALGVSILVAGLAYSRHNSAEQDDDASANKHRLNGSVEKRMKTFNHMIEINSRSGSVSSRDSVSPGSPSNESLVSDDESVNTRSTRKSMRSSVRGLLSNVSRKQFSFGRKRSDRSARSTAVEDDAYSRADEEGMMEV